MKREKKTGTYILKQGRKKETKKQRNKETKKETTKKRQVENKNKPKISNRERNKERKRERIDKLPHFSRHPNVKERTKYFFLEFGFQNLS